MPKNARELSAALLGQPGFAEYADRLQIVAVELESAQSGLSHPSIGDSRDTALGAIFDARSLDRIINVPDRARMADRLQDVPYEHIIVLANTGTYSGCGPYNAYSIGYAGDWRREVGVHEFGHTFAGLGDEYEANYPIEFPPDIEPQEPNITTMADFSCKWQNLIDEGKAGLIEGAGYVSEGVWRGCESCLMRTVQEETFCPVCAQAISRVILLYTEEDPSCGIIRRMDNKR